MIRITHAIIALLMMCNSAIATPRACVGTPKTGTAQEVTISGMLTKETAWGPPNFGQQPETDSKIAVWIVRLDHPLTALLGTEFGEPGIPATEMRMQIIYDSLHPHALDHFIAKHVIVTGNLSGQTAPSETTKIVMYAKTLAPILRSVTTTCFVHERRQ